MNNEQETTIIGGWQHHAPNTFGMFSDAGNAMVAEVMAQLLRKSTELARPLTPDEIWSGVEPIGKLHPEVTDTVVEECMWEFISNNKIYIEACS